MKLSKWLLICLIVLIVNIKSEGKRRKRRFSLLNSKEEEKTKIDSVDKEIIGAIKQTYVSTKKIDEVINQINHCKDKICNNNTNTTNPTSKPTKHNSKIKQKKIQKGQQSNDNSTLTSLYQNPTIIYPLPPLRPLYQQVIQIQPQQLHPLSRCYSPILNPSLFPSIFDPVQSCHLCCYNELYYDKMALNCCYERCSYSSPFAFSSQCNSYSFPYKGETISFNSILIN